jgi:hypothetical protein
MAVDGTAHALTFVVVLLTAIVAWLESNMLMAPISQ